MRDKSRPKRRQGWGLSLVLVAGMVLAAVAGFFFVSSVLLAGGGATQLQGPEVKSLGAADAPVTVVVYSDFQ